MFGLPHVMQVGGGGITVADEKKWVRRHRFLFPFETFLKINSVSASKRHNASLAAFGLVHGRDFVYVPSKINPGYDRYLFRDRDKVLEWKLSTMD